MEMPTFWTENVPCDISKDPDKYNKKIQFIKLRRKLHR